MRSLHWLICALLWLSLVACAGGDRKHLKLVFKEDRVQRSLKRIAFVRGLEAKHSVTVRQVGPSEYAKVVESMSADTSWQDHGLNEELDAALTLWTGIISDGTGYEPEEPIGVAMYDQVTKIVYIDESRSKEGSEVIENVLAHELTHALQDQLFGMPDWTKIGSLDELLAVRGLYEGDASLVGLIADAQRHSRSWKDVMSSLMADLRSGSLDEQMFRLDKKENTAEVFNHFLYIRGALFAYSIYLKGGFALLDAAYKNPPSTTEQVLHPEKYLAGEQPVLITLPPTPPGWRTLKGSTIGELGTRFFLTRCLKWKTAIETASGWGGDRLIIFEKDDKVKALIWIVAWDTNEAADRFHRKVDDNQYCFGAAADFNPASGGLVEPEVHKKDSLVSVSLGFPPYLAKIMLKLVEIQKQAPPEKVPTDP